MSFQDLRANFRSVHSGLAGHIFYGWLAWLLFIGIVIVGLLAFWRRMPPMGLVAGCLVVIALMSLPSTFVDLDNSRFLQHAGYGIWAWMAGQVLAVAGATLAHFARSHSAVEEATPRPERASTS